MAFDEHRGRAVLFGGRDASNNFNWGDTWEWDGSTWSQVSTSGPAARHRHSMAYDSTRNVTVLFGGDAINSSNSLGDTWEWNGSTWLQFAAVGPPQRNDHAMAYDSQNGRLVLFGGLFQGDTWTRWDAVLPAAATPYGTGCGSPPLNLAEDPTARPIIGTNAVATVTNCPTPLVASAVGFSNTQFGPIALPLSLQTYGASGCDLLQSLEFGWFLPTVNTGPGTASFSFPVPQAPQLVGQLLYVQTWAAAPGVNPAGLIVSNGLKWTFGDH